MAYSLSTLANIATAQGDNAMAVKLASEAVDILHHAGRDATAEAILIRNTYALAVWMGGRDEEALTEMDRVLDGWKRIAPSGNSRRVPMLVLKAQILDEMKRNEEAKRVANEAIALNVEPAEIADLTKKLLRQLSGRTDVYPEVADSK